MNVKYPAKHAEQYSRDTSHRLKSFKEAETLAFMLALRILNEPASKVAHKLSKDKVRKLLS